MYPYAPVFLLRRAILHTTNYSVFIAIRLTALRGQIRAGKESTSAQTLHCVQAPVVERSFYSSVATPARLERAAFSSAGKRSNPLSYGVISFQPSAV